MAKFLTVGGLIGSFPKIKKEKMRAKVQRVAES